MLWKTTMATLALAAALAVPAAAQQTHQGQEHGRMMQGHGRMMDHGEDHRMGPHGSMVGWLTSHASELGLTAEQTAKIQALDARFSAEMERHRAEMTSIHESLTEVLTPEQRDQVRQMMQSEHGRHGQWKDDEKKEEGEQEENDSGS